jgi:hypothetical protein
MIDFEPVKNGMIDPAWLVAPPIHPNREAWLQAAAERFAPRFTALGHPLPPLRIAIGFPSTGRGSAVIAECWHHSASQDGVTEIWVAPQYGADPVEMLAFLAHELCHAALGPGFGHGREFGQLASAMGLEPPFATYGPESIGLGLRSFAAGILPWLGAFPHGTHKLALSVGAGEDTPHGRRCSGGSDRRAQTSRMLKVQCAKCGYTARVARKWLDAVGAPICPAEGHGMMRLKAKED